MESCHGLRGEFALPFSGGPGPWPSLGADHQKPASASWPVAPRCPDLRGADRPVGVGGCQQRYSPLEAAFAPFHRGRALEQQKPAVAPHLGHPGRGAGRVRHCPGRWGPSGRPDPPISDPGAGHLPLGYRFPDHSHRGHCPAASHLGGLRVAAQGHRGGPHFLFPHRGQHRGWAPGGRP